MYQPPTISCSLEKVALPLLGPLTPHKNLRDNSALCRWSGGSCWLFDEKKVTLRREVLFLGAVGGRGKTAVGGRGTMTVGGRGTIAVGGRWIIVFGLRRILVMGLSRGEINVSRFNIFLEGTLTFSLNGSILFSASHLWFSKSTSETLLGRSYFTSLWFLWITIWFSFIAISADIRQRFLINGVPRDAKFCRPYLSSFDMDTFASQRSTLSLARIRLRSNSSSNTITLLSRAMLMSCLDSQPTTKFLKNIHYCYNHYFFIKFN